MARGVVAEIWSGYADPRGAMARRVGEGLSEPRAMIDLFLACGLGFVASLPAAVREAARIDVADSLSAVISAHLFGYLFVGPLLLYGVAAAIHLAARAFGARGGFLAARSALFWSALLGAPLALGAALAGVAVEVVAGVEALRFVVVLSYLAFAFWLWLFAASLAEAEGLGGTRRVAAVMAVLFVGVAAGLRAAAGGDPTFG